jgi:hypothetical protein
MKNLFGISGVFLLVFLIHSCSKDDNSTNDNSIKDGDGNIYDTITIGTQVWLEENLKTTKYYDGISIPLVTGNTAWYNLSTPGYCWYDNNASEYKDSKGALYNWFAVNTGKLCPTGWHVPSKEEWTTLINWLTINPTGFIATSGGYRHSFTGVFYSIGLYGNWWSTTLDVDDPEHYACSCMANSISYDFWMTSDPKTAGFSVRCIKDSK